MHGVPSHLGHLLVNSIQDSQESRPRVQELGPVWKDVSIPANAGFRPLASLHSYLGMDAAVMVLQSMEKGRGGGMVKYGTARKARATLTVL